MSTALTKYLCGFNGFGQIDQITGRKRLHEISSNMECNTVKPIEAALEQEKDVETLEASFYSSPLTLAAEVLMMNWSQIFGIEENGQVKCCGYNSETVTSTLNENNTQGGDVFIPCGRDVLLGNRQHYRLLREDGTVSVCRVNEEIIATKIDATKDKLFALQGDALLIGDLPETREGNEKFISLQSVLPGIKITNVACGFEHVVMLSLQGTVFSCGSGSRGQLGHGEVTVDVQNNPRLVDTFQGIHIVSIAAGGWHSTAVSDMGDVYVWGWNESGQLGLPNRTTSGGRFLNTDHTSQELDRESEFKAQNKDNVLPFDPEGIVASSHPVCPLINSGKNTGRYDVASFSSTGSRISDCVSEKYYQPLDCVQVQTVPYGLELPDDLTVRSVSCGTRHTCVLLESGILLTAGWNKYGQLCQGDTECRDYLQVVRYFVERDERVFYVMAQYWNTYIVTEKIKT